MFICSLFPILVRNNVGNTILRKNENEILLIFRSCFSTSLLLNLFEIVYRLPVKFGEHLQTVKLHAYNA